MRAAGSSSRRTASEESWSGQKSTETSGTAGASTSRHPDAELLLDLLLELVGEVGVVLEEGAGVLLALAELVAVVGVPGAGLADEALLDAHVDQAALAGDALAVEDVELGLLERRAHLVLDDLAPGAVADRVGAVLERLDAAHVEADRGVELQRLATGRGLGRAEHDADLLAQLVDEDRGGAGGVERTGDLAQRLGHQAGLEADVAVAHLALDLGPGHQGRDRVDDDDVEGAGADQHVGDLERLLAGVGLGDEQRVGVDAELLGVLGVERVLGVDERGDAAGLLRVGDRVQGDGRLAELSGP